MQRFLVWTVLIALTACTSTKKTINLDGGWKLTSLTGYEITKKDFYPIIIKGNTIHGNLPCNKFSGQLVYAEGKYHIKQLISTKRHCQEMKLETKILNAMRSCNKIVRKEGSLIFFTNEKQTLLCSKK